MTARKNTGLKIKIASSIVSPRALAAQNASVAAADLDTEIESGESEIDDGEYVNILADAPFLRSLGYNIVSNDDKAAEEQALDRLQKTMEEFATKEGGEIDDQDQRSIAGICTATFSTEEGYLRVYGSLDHENAPCYQAAQESILPFCIKVGNPCTTIEAAFKSLRAAKLTRS